MKTRRNSKVLQASKKRNRAGASARAKKLRQTSSWQARGSRSRYSGSPVRQRQKGKNDGRKRHSSLRNLAGRWRSQTSAVLALPNDSLALLPGWLSVLRELQTGETILVTGPLEESALQAVREQLPGAVLLQFAEPSKVTPQALAMGAEIARMPILLMLGGQPQPASSLAPFARLVAQGAQIAINDPTPAHVLFAERDPVSIVHQFINLSLGSEQLGSGSLKAVPYAISRRAAEQIGFARLAQPELTLALALELKMSVRVAGHLPSCADPVRAAVPVEEDQASISADHPPSANEGPTSLLSSLEGLHDAMNKRGKRLKFPDLLRNRRAAEEER